MESLNSLANTNCFHILQEKLNDWKYEFEHNCNEANISRCCELLELNARIQTQLFKLLGFCGLHGGLDGSEIKLKNQLLPYLGKDYFENGLTSNVVIDILNDVGRQKKKSRLNSVNGRKSNYQKNNCSKDRMDNSTQNCRRSNSFENGMKTCPKAVSQGIYDKLDELENIIIDLSNESKVCKPSKKKKRHSTHRSNSLPKSSLNGSIKCDNTDIATRSEPSGDFSGSDVEEIRNDTYLQGLVGRYNDLFSESRIKAMDHLKQYYDDHENNQRILFALVMITAKHVIELQRTYRESYGPHVKSNHTLQFRETIPRSTTKNIRTRVIHELINNRGKYFRFHLPAEFSFLEIEDLMNHTIQLFWNFGGAKNSLRLMEAADGELFDEHKYRRSYDSDFNAPLVSHHIWPCLIQNHRVLVKGEACTRSSNQMTCKIQIQNKTNSNPSRCLSK